MEFDPRFSIYDDPDTFEHDLITQNPSPPPRSKYAPTPEHLARCAAAKTAAAQLRRLCLDCGMQLYANTNAKRCVTCQARRKVAMDRERRHARRRVNHSFVGHSKGYPLPGGIHDAHRNVDT